MFAASLRLQIANCIGARLGRMGHQLAQVNGLEMVSRSYVVIWKRHVPSSHYILETNGTQQIKWSTWVGEHWNEFEFRVQHFVRPLEGFEEFLEWIKEKDIIMNKVDIEAFARDPEWLMGIDVEEKLE